jgi:O-antigen ligase
MSRGLLLTIAITSILFLWISYRKAGRMVLESPRKYIRTLLLFLIPITVASIVTWGVFAPVSERFQEISLDRPIGTILLRFSLWKAAINGFLTSPFTGIGIGNFRMIDTILPNLKFDPVRYYITGMSFHNVFLQYLCETGIIGAAAFLWLVSSALFTSIKIIRRTIAAEELIPSMAVFIGVLVIFITTFYMRAWTWGQEGFVFAFVLSLVARQYRKMV